MASGDTNKWVGGTTNSTTVWAVAANWSLGSVPVSGEYVVLPAGASYGITGTDATATKLSGLDIEYGFTQNIGSATTPLQLSMSTASNLSTVTLGGTGTVHLSVADASRINIIAAGAGATGTYGLNLTGDTAQAASTTIDISAAVNQKIAIGTNAGTSVEADVIVLRGGATVMLYGGLTDRAGTDAPTLYMTDGVLTSEAALKTVTQDGGTLTIDGSAAVTTLTVSGGTTHDNSTGTTTTENIFDGGAVYHNVAKTVTNCNLSKGGKLHDPLKLVTFSNNIDLENCQPDDVTLDIGTHITLARSAVD